MKKIFSFSWVIGTVLFAAQNPISISLPASDPLGKVVRLDSVNDPVSPGHVEEGIAVGYYRLNLGRYSSEPTLLTPEIAARVEVVDEKLTLSRSGALSFYLKTPISFFGNKNGPNFVSHTVMFRFRDRTDTGCDNAIVSLHDLAVSLFSPDIDQARTIAVPTGMSESSTRELGQMRHPTCRAIAGNFLFANGNHYSVMFSLRSAMNITRFGPWFPSPTLPEGCGVGIWQYDSRLELDVNLTDGDAGFSPGLRIHSQATSSTHLHDVALWSTNEGKLELQRFKSKLVEFREDRGQATLVGSEKCLCMTLAEDQSVPFIDRCNLCSCN